MSAALGHEFFDRPVNDVARDLIGCTLEFEGPAPDAKQRSRRLVGGTIVETEAYDSTDPACHGYAGIGRTARNDPIFGPPGYAYVYLSYGIHHLLNFVCEEEGSAAAVLVRAIEPSLGIEEMRLRRRGLPDRQLCSGPGKLTEALGIGPEHNRADLAAPPFAILPRQGAAPEIHAGLRIGISKGVELPWRYCAAGSPFLSAPPRD